MTYRKRVRKASSSFHHTPSSSPPGGPGSPHPQQQIQQQSLQFRQDLWDASFPPILPSVTTPSPVMVVIHHTVLGQTAWNKVKQSLVLLGFPQIHQVLLKSGFSCS